jgi:hypothetical protein
MESITTGPSTLPLNPSSSTTAPVSSLPASSATAHAVSPMESESREERTTLQSTHFDVFVMTIYAVVK